MSPASAPSAPRSFIYAPPKEPLNIVHVDADILVLNKPAGLLTVAGKTPDLADCLEARAQSQFEGAKVVHRLDKDTSGLIVLGLTAQAHAHIGLQFEKRQTRKTYVADVWGPIAEDKGTIDQPMTADWPNRPKQHIDPVNGRNAVTDWQVSARSTNHSRVTLTPATGRTHQLRVHMAFLGHPILGDNLYAHKEALEAAPRLCLHAMTLEFIHPTTLKPLKFTTQTPF